MQKKQIISFPPGIPLDPEQVLREGKQTAVNEMQQHAAALGANAIIGVDLDYETVGSGGSMLMVAATGTAVILED